MLENIFTPTAPTVKQPFLKASGGGPEGRAGGEGVHVPLHCSLKKIEVSPLIPQTIKI